MDGRVVHEVSKDVVQIVLGIENHAIPKPGKEEAVDAEVVRGGDLQWGRFQNVREDIVWIGRLVPHVAREKELDARLASAQAIVSGTGMFRLD